MRVGRVITIQPRLIKQSGYSRFGILSPQYPATAAKISGDCGTDKTLSTET